MPQIESTLVFRSGLPVSVELLGQEICIFINGIRGLICFPQLNIDTKNYNHNVDRIFDTLKKPKKLKINTTHEERFDWGYVSEFPTGNSRINAIQLIFELSSYEKFYEIGNKIKIELDKLIPYVLELIEIIKKTIYLKDDDSPYVDYHLAIRNKENKLRTATNLPIHLYSTIYRDKDYIKKSELLFALKRAYLKKEIKTEYKLQHSGRKSFLKGDYRRAILDSATAVEIAFTNLILKELETIGKPQFTKKLLGKFRALGGRYELIKLLKIPVPKHNYNKDLIDPRNDTVHKGVVPNKETAQKVLKIADELLYEKHTNYFLK